MEEKSNKLKLTLSKNINIEGITSRLNLLAGKSDIANKDQANKSFNNRNTDAIKDQGSISEFDKKARKDQQRKQQQLTKTDTHSNAAESIKLKDKKVEQSIKGDKSKTANIAKAKDNATVKDQAKNEIKKEQQQQQQDKQNKDKKEKKNDKETKEHKTISFKGVLSKLRQLYPIAFPGDETKIVALKVGINKDIKDNAELMNSLRISITYLGKFLKWYTSSKNYRTSTQLEGNARYNLKGDTEGIVTKEQAEDIRKRL